MAFKLSKYGSTIDADGIKVSLSGYRGGASKFAMDAFDQKRARLARLLSKVDEMYNKLIDFAPDSAYVRDLIAFIEPEEKG